MLWLVLTVWFNKGTWLAVCCAGVTHRSSGNHHQGEPELCPDQHSCIKPAENKKKNDAHSFTPWINSVNTTFHSYGWVSCFKCLVTLGKSLLLEWRRWRHYEGHEVFRLTVWPPQHLHRDTFQRQAWSLITIISEKETTFYFENYVFLFRYDNRTSLKLSSDYVLIYPFIRR